VPRELSDKQLKEYTQEWSKMLEKIIRQHPEQWVWMHNRWKTGQQGEKTVKSGDTSVNIGANSDKNGPNLTAKETLSKTC